MESIDRSLIDSARKNPVSSSSGILSNISLIESFEDNQSLTNQIDQLNLNVDQDPIKALSYLILDQLNTQDTNAILDAQKQTIQRLDQTNRNLAKCNQISRDTFQTFALKDFQSYISTLNTMRQDLEFIFRRVKAIKNKFQSKYPSEYEKALHDNSHLLFDSDDEEQGAPKTSNRNEILSDHNAQVENVFKDRASSVESSNSVASAASNASAALVNLVQTARDKITTSSKGLVSVFINPPTESEYAVGDYSNKDYEAGGDGFSPEIQAELNADELDKTVENENEEAVNQDEQTEN